MSAHPQEMAVNIFTATRSGLIAIVVNVLGVLDLNDSS